MRILLLAAIALTGATTATAEPFPIPGRPVRVVVGFAAGGGTDLQARQLAPHLAAALGAPVVVENRPGASTAIAAQEVARSAPDGHTLLYTFAGTFVQNPHTQPNLPYDPFVDFTPVSLAARGPLVLVAPASLGVTRVVELAAIARSRPEPLAYASFGPGTSSHLYGELLARHFGIAATHVPYKGSGDAARDLASGRVDYMFDSAASALPRVRDGTMRALGVAATQRSRFLPDIPTLAEQGVADIDRAGWLGYFGPAGLAPAVRDRLADAIARATSSPDLKDAFARGAYEAVASTPDELARLVREDHAAWAGIFRRAGIAPR